MKDTQLIDVHAHYLTDRYRQAVVDAGHGQPDGVPGLPAWSAERALSVMDRLNIQTAMLSISSPGVHFGDARAAARLARDVNEEGARLASDHGLRFGLFAAVPLPDLDASLAEAAHALDVLGADGIAVKTNHGGHYLGDPCFDPFFAEMDRRGALLFMHPTSPNCPCCADLAMGYPRPLIEFFFETTRAVTNLIVRGTLRRFRNVRLIVPHAGACLPVMAERVARLVPIMGLADPVSPEDVYRDLAGLYYDLAGFPVPLLLDALAGIAAPDRMLYGSDWPFTPEDLAARALQSLKEGTMLDAAQRADMFRNTALSLLAPERQEAYKEEARRRG